MKQLYLTLFFTVYSIFMPFVLLNCSDVDAPYAIDPNAQTAAAPTLEECEAQTYMSEDCVEVLQNAQEAEAQFEETVATAYADIPEFISCAAYTAADAAATADTATVNCAEVVPGVADGFTACQTLTADERDFACEQIIDRVTTATQQCTNQDAAVTTDFCALLS